MMLVITILSLVFGVASLASAIFANGKLVSQSCSDSLASKKLQVDNDVWRKHADKLGDRLAAAEGKLYTVKTTYSPSHESLMQDKAELQETLEQIAALVSEYHDCEDCDR